MLTKQQYMHDSLRKLIVQEIDRITLIIISPHSNLDLVEYRRKIGYIEGLRATLDLLTEAENIAERAY